MLEKLDEAEIDAFLEKQTIGRIGCCADGKPYVVPVSYVYDGSFFYCHTHEGMKIDMMRKNPKVCFEVDAYLHSATWESAITWGDFIEINDETERNKILESMIANKLPIISSEAMRIELGTHYPFLPVDMTDIKGIVYKIKVTEKTGRKEVNQGYKSF